MIKEPPHQRVLITGASGFIGRALATYLVRRGHTVTALSRAPVAMVGVQWAEVQTYIDIARMTHLLRGHDVVIHLAALAHRQISGDAKTIAAAFATNAVATHAVAVASATAGLRRFILISSIGVNGQHTEARPFNEEDPAQPAEPYAVSKLQCELALYDVAAQHPSMDFVTIRPPLVYGPNAPGNFSQLFQAIANRSLLPLGAVTNLRSFVGLENLLDLIELCMYHPQARNQIYLVSDGEDVSTAEFVRRIGLALGTPARLLNIPLPLIRMLARLAGRSTQIERLVASLQVDSNKARRQLAWTPPLTLDEGLRRAANGTARRS